MNDCFRKAFNQGYFTRFSLRQDLADLTNGQTLCRMCHKEKHKNWGSHNIL